MPTLSKRRETGEWFAQFYSADRRPKQKRIYLGTTIKREAYPLYRDLLHRQAKGLWCPWDGELQSDLALPESPLSLGEAIARYLEWKRTRKRRPVKESSIKQDWYVLKQVSEYFDDGMIPVWRLTSEELNDWLDDGEREVITRHRYHGRLSAFFRWCIDEGIATENPAANMRVESPPDSYPKYLTPKEHKHLVTVIRDRGEPYHQWIASLVEVNVLLGLRRGEVQRLERGDIRFSRNGDPSLLHVRHYGKVTTKSRRERTIPIAKSAERILRELIPEGGDPSAKVFRDHRGMLTGDHITKTFARYRKMADLPEYVTFHTLRHTACTWLAAKGTPVKAIQMFAGHSRLSTTEKYMHVAPTVYNRHIADAFETVADIF